MGKRKFMPVDLYPDFVVRHTLTGPRDSRILGGSKLSESLKNDTDYCQNGRQQRI